MDVSESYKNEIKPFIAKLCENEGFKSYRQNKFIRRKELYSEVIFIDFHRSVSSSDHYCYTIDYGFFIPVFYKLLYGKMSHAASVISPVNYLLDRTLPRIKQLDDSWYNLNKNTDIELQKRKINEHFNSALLPFFNEINTAKKLCKSLVDSHGYVEIITAGFLLSELGEKEKGMAIVSEYYQKLNDYWRDKMNENLGYRE